MSLARLTVVGVALLFLAMLPGQGQGTGSRVGDSAPPQAQGSAPAARNPPAKQQPRTDHKAIQGTWRVIDGEHQGRVTSDDLFEAKTFWVITGDKIALKSPHASGVGWRYRLDPTKTPPQIDLTGFSAQGKRTFYPSIYRLQGDRLQFCLPGIDQVRPTEFRTHPKRPGLVLYTLKREPSTKTVPRAAALNPWRPRAWNPRIAQPPGIIALSPTGKLAITGKGPKLWDIETGKELAVLADPPSRPGPRFANPPEMLGLPGQRADLVRAAVFSPDGKTAVITWSNGTVRLWEVQTRGPRGVLGVSRPHDPRNNGTLFAKTPRALAFRPDGRILPMLKTDCGLQLWDIASGKLLVVCGRHWIAMTCMAFAPDGKTLAIGDHHGDVYLWDTVTGKELHRFARHNGQVKALAFSPNGKLLATAGADQTVQLWDLQKREHRWTFRGHRKGVMATLFTPDGKHLLSGGADGTVCIWDLAREEQVGVLSHTFQVGALALSADGRVLTVSGGTKVQQWEATPRR